MPLDPKLDQFILRRYAFLIPAAQRVVLLEHGIQLGYSSLCRTGRELFAQQARRKRVLLHAGGDVEALLEIPDALALEQDLFVGFVGADRVAVFGREVRQANAERREQAGAARVDQRRQILKEL